VLVAVPVTVAVVVAVAVAVAGAVEAVAVTDVADSGLAVDVTVDVGSLAGCDVMGLVVPPLSFGAWQSNTLTSRAAPMAAFARATSAVQPAVLLCNLPVNEQDTVPSERAAPLAYTPMSWLMAIAVATQSSPATSVLNRSPFTAVWMGLQTTPRAATRVAPAPTQTPVAATSTATCASQPSVGRTSGTELPLGLDPPRHSMPPGGAVVLALVAAVVAVAAAVVAVVVVAVVIVVVPASVV
jgi:hypothetical protein